MGKNKSMLIDPPAHVNFNVYKADADEVIRRSLEGDTWMINVGSQYSTSKRAVEMAEKYKEGIYAAVGLHPIHVEDESKNINSSPSSLSQSESSLFDYEKYKQLALSERGERRVVAIGEIGLDYKTEYISLKEKQKEVFLKQL